LRKSVERVSSYDGEALQSSYEKSPHCYDVEDLITLKVFLQVHKGTVFYSKTLWIETCSTGLLYWVTFGVLFYFRWENFSDFVGKEANIRAFIAMFSTLIGLLLSFYTALNLGRWWQMRMLLQDVQEGCKSLCLQLAHGVTSDAEVLGSVRRYCRASLFLVFAYNHDRDDTPLDAAVRENFLEPDEAEALRQINPTSTFAQAEVLWSWLANIVTRLHLMQMTKGKDPQYCALLKAVDKGRSGVAGIQTFLETPIPMGYIHLLCWMVKLHNIILTLLMALSSVKHAGGREGFDEVSVFRTAFRAFFMPFLYNAILILNAEVTDPFGNDVQDFDQKYFGEQMDKCAGSLIDAAHILPPWLSQHIKENKSFAAFGESPSSKFEAVKSLPPNQP